MVSIAAAAEQRTMDKKLKIGVPKGSLEDATMSLFKKAGFSFYGTERSLWLTSNDRDLEPVLLRPQEIPIYVASGSLDCGLAGLDWILERNCEDDVRILADLCFSKRSFRPVKWVIAVAQDSPYQTVDDLRDKEGGPLIISTELKNLTESWLSERGIVAEVDFSWGATEAKVPMFADAIVDCTETGESLRANGLRILDTVVESTTQFFANKEVFRTDEWKRQKLEGIALLLRSCLEADTKVSIHVEVSNGAADTLKALLPEGVKSSIWQGDDGQMLLNIIVGKEDSRELIPSLARNGATRIQVSNLGLLYESGHEHD